MGREALMQAVWGETSVEDANLAGSISAMTQADAAHRAALGALADAGRPSLMDYLK